MLRQAFQPSSGKTSRQRATETGVNSRTPGAVAGPELNRPWNIDATGQVDTDGARIISSEPLLQTASQGGARYGSSYRSTNDSYQGSPYDAPDSALAGNRSVTQTPPTGPSLSKAIAPGSFGKMFLNEFRASNNRNWSPNHAVLATAEFSGSNVAIRNIRYSVYKTASDYKARYYDATFNLDDIRTLDIIAAPFSGLSSLAHIEASFGFTDGRHVAVSIESRYEQGETYDPLGAVTNQFELIYVIADERDLIRLYTQVNKNDVYLYRLKLSPQEVRNVFEGILVRANKLAEKPEFYHAVSNNCATNLIAHINKARPGTVPRDYRARFSGYLDHLLYDRGLLDVAGDDFKTAKENAKINWLAEKFGDIEYFSAGIRQHLY